MNFGVSSLLYMYCTCVTFVTFSAQLQGDGGVGENAVEGAAVGEEGQPANEGAAVQAQEGKTKANM